MISSGNRTSWRSLIIVRAHFGPANVSQCCKRKPPVKVSERTWEKLKDLQFRVVFSVQRAIISSFVGVSRSAIALATCLINRSARCRDLKLPSLIARSCYKLVCFLSFSHQMLRTLELPCFVQLWRLSQSRSPIPRSPNQSFGLSFAYLPVSSKCDHSPWVETSWLPSAKHSASSFTRFPFSC